MDKSLPITKKRIVSIDILRGIAMFLIISIDIGGADILPAFTKLWGERFADLMADLFRYSFTEGVCSCFIAMPMFLFIVGTAIPFSIANRFSRNQSRKQIYKHIVFRSLLLFLLGLIAGGHLLQLEFSTMKLYNNVLEYIAIGYLVCCILFLNTSKKARIAISLFLLIFYYVIFLLIPVPGGKGEPFSGEMNLAILLDNLVLGNHHNPGSWQVPATISFVANMLLGIIAGELIMENSRNEKIPRSLFVYGLVMVITGYAWSPFFPVIRSLWTSSFVLVTCGISTLILAFLYYVADVKGHTKWALLFTVFGVNSIAVYMMAHLFNFRLIGNIFVGGLTRFMNSDFRNFTEAMAAMTVIWLIMYCMYRKKIFIKI